MISALAQRVFGTSNTRYLKRLEKTVAEINALEPEIEALSDEALRGLVKVGAQIVILAEKSPSFSMHLDDLQLDFGARLKKPPLE